METKKEIIKEIEKSLQDAMETLWKVERKYGDIHHVMNTLRDGNIISNNMQGALLKLTIERYFERHEGETEFNDVKKAINDISDAKIKMIELQAKTMIENELQSRKIFELERQQKEMKEAIEKNKAKSVEKIIDVEIPEDQEMDIILRPTPVKEDIFKLELDEDLSKEWTAEAWDIFRGKNINKINGLNIKKNVAGEIEKNLEKGPQYILNVIMQKYYPKSSRKSHGTYTRNYYKHFGKEVSIPNKWIIQKPSKEEIAEMEKHIETYEEISEADLNKMRGETIKHLKRINIKKKVMEEIKENYSKGPKYLIKNILSKYYPKAKTRSKVLYLREYANELGHHITIPLSIIQEIDQSKEPDESCEKVMVKPDLTGGRQITGKIAKKVQKRYSAKLTNKKYNAIIQAINNKPGLGPEEYSDMTGIKKNPTYAHLRFGVEIGDIKSEHKKYTLKPNGVLKVKKTIKTPKFFSIDQTKDKQKPEKISERNQKQAKIFNKKYGTKLTDKIAQEMEKKYHQSIRVPTINIILEEIRKNPGSKVKDMKDRHNIPVQKANAYIQYGVAIGKLISDQNGKYYFVEGEKLVEDPAKQPEVKKSEKTIRPREKGLTPITDAIAQNIHITYGSPVYHEIYNDLKNLLEGAFMYKKTIQEIAEQKEWTEHSTYVHMLYGLRTKEIISCGKDGNKTQYCLKKHEDKINKPKEIKAKTKSWLRLK